MNTDIEQVLREGMERSTRGLAMPAGLAHKAAGDLRRRQYRTRAATAVGTAAVVAAAAVALTGTGGAARPGAGPRIQTTAYVVGRVKRALTAASTAHGLVEHASTRYSPGVIEIPNPDRLTLAFGPPGVRFPWVIGSESDWIHQGRIRQTGATAAGRLVFDNEIDLRGRPVETEVTYFNRTWWRARRPGGSHLVLPPKGVDTWSLAGSVSDWVHFQSLDRRSILRDLATHRYRIRGHQRVDGINTVKLVAVDATARTPDTIWVDPATYLPVRWLATMTFVAAPSGRAWTSQTDYRWLAPTRANLAQLDVRIPAGFTRVPAP